MRAKRMTVNERFWAKVDKSAGDSGCWLWTASTVHCGYGAFRVGDRATGKLVRAHRFAWELEHGPIPDGKYLLHSCDTTRCVNPAHLSVGTQADNMADMRRKRRHAIGERCGSSKLSERDIARVFEMRRSGMTMKQIGASVGVMRQTIASVLAGNTWTHVERER